MARSRRPRIPKMQLHKASGQAVVRLGGRDIYLGRYGTPEAGTGSQVPHSSPSQVPVLLSRKRGGHGVDRPGRDGRIDGVGH